MHWFPALPGGMVSVRHGVLHGCLVAGQARLVGVCALEPWPSTSRVAMVAVELPRADARAREPGGQRVVLTQVAAVGVKVGMLERDQIEMVEERVTRLEARGNGHHLGMARGAHVVHLGRCEIPGPNDLQVLDVVSTGRILLHHPDVLAGRAVARLAAYARLGPGCLVRVGLQVIVGGKLADMTVEACGVEGEEPVGPVERLVLSIGKVPDAGGRRVVPLSSCGRRRRSARPASGPAPAVSGSSRRSCRPSHGRSDRSSHPMGFVLAPAPGLSSISA